MPPGWLTAHPTHDPMPQPRGSLNTGAHTRLVVARVVDGARIRAARDNGGVGQPLRAARLAPEAVRRVTYN